MSENTAKPTTDTTGAAIGSRVKAVVRFRMAWRDGIVKEVDATSLDEAVCIAQKGYPFTHAIIANHAPANTHANQQDAT